MRVRLSLVLVMLILPIVSFGGTSVYRNLLDTLSFPIYPGARLVSSIGLPSGPILNQLEKELKGTLPISNLKEVSVAAFSLKSSPDSAEVVKFYEPVFAAKGWSILVSAINRSGDATVILAKRQTGLLIVDVDPPTDEDRELTFVSVTGTIDTSKIDKRVVFRVGEILSDTLKPDTSIPVGEPISVPPSDKLNVQFVKSNVFARFGGQNTVRLNLLSKLASAGELTRTPDGRLLLSISPKLDVNEMILPKNVPVLLEPTDGSLTVSFGNTQYERPSRLSIISTSAPVKLDSFPLVSGRHSVKIVGASIETNLSQVQDGVLEIEVDSGNITLEIPVSSSVTISASVVSGKIMNNMTVDQPKGENLKLKLGAGKAQITLRAVNGNISIRPAR
jgi:hypothetical protein